MGTDWVVTGGLANGEQVLVSGQMKLMPGVEKVQTVPYADLLKHERAALAAPAAASASSAQPASAPKS